MVRLKRSRLGGGISVLLGSLLAFTLVVPATGVAADEGNDRRGHGKNPGSYTNPLLPEVPGDGVVESCADPTVIRGQQPGEMGPGHDNDRRICVDVVGSTRPGTPGGGGAFEQRGERALSGTAVRSDPPQPREVRGRTSGQPVDGIRGHDAGLRLGRAGDPCADVRRSFSRESLTSAVSSELRRAWAKAGRTADCAMYPSPTTAYRMRGSSGCWSPFL